jgi:hypothetical protein
MRRSSVLQCSQRARFFFFFFLEMPKILSPIDFGSQHPHSSGAVAAWKRGKKKNALGVRRAFNVKAFHLVIRRYENCACNVNQIRAAYRCSNGNGSSESERRSWGGGRMSDERIGASSRQVAGPALRALLYAVARPKEKPPIYDGRERRYETAGGKVKIDSFHA